MAWQLIFTSAAAGLQPGSFGYCTVARSAAMRDAVAVQLEQLSIYTHSTSGAQPVVCAHRLLVVGRTTYHVLSRIVDGGLDYTGRTNFLAHHLVLQDFELGEVSSPADIFARWDGWRSQWAEDPRLLTPEEDVFSLRVSVATRLPAENWKAVVGDAAAATWLVNDAGTGARAANLIVPPAWEGEWLLALYAESLCLLDPKGTGTAGWSIPFTTYLQREDDAADFQWRGAWHEGDFRGIAGETVNFAVTRFPEVPRGGGMASLARTGMKLEVKHPSVIAQDHGRATPTYSDDYSRAERTSHSYSRMDATPEPRRWLPIVLCIVGTCVVLGTLILFLLTRLNTRESVVRIQPSPPIVSPSPAVAILDAGVTPTPTPLPTVPPIPTPEDLEAKKARVQAQDAEDRKNKVTDELAKLPDAPIFFTVKSVKTLAIQEAPSTNWKSFIERFGAENAAFVDIELRQGRLENSTPKLHSHHAIPGKNRLTEDVEESSVTTDLAYSFSDKFVTVESKVIAEDFVWLTLKPERKDVAPINFVLATDENAFGARCPRLSWNVFVQSSSSPVAMELEPQSFKRLRDKLITWNGLQDWTDKHGVKKRFELEVTLTSGQTLHASDESKVSFDDDTGNIDSILRNAQEDNREAQKLLNTEIKRQEDIARIRKHLLSPKFSDAVKKTLGDDAVVKEADVSDMGTYNREIISWLQKVARENQAIGSEKFDPPISTRFSLITQKQEYYLHLTDILDQLAKDAQAKGPKSQVGSLMLILIDDIRRNITNEDAMFFEQSPTAMSPDDMRRIMQQRKQHAIFMDNAEKDATTRALNKPTLEKVQSVWLQGRIDDKDVRLVEFSKP